MKKAVNIHEAKTHLSQLLERVIAGEKITIAHAGKPIARLVAVKPPSARRPGIAKGRLTEAFFEPLPEDEILPWET